MTKEQRSSPMVLQVVQQGTRQDNICVPGVFLTRYFKPKETRVTFGV